jgi:hypothetical protein
MVDILSQITRRIPLVKLDRVMMSKIWEIMFPFVTLTRLSRELSDHNPLIVETDRDIKTNQFTFHFENEWLAHLEFTKIIEDIWDKPCRAKSILDKILQKLKLCKQYLKVWDWNRKGNQMKRKGQIIHDPNILEEKEE